MCRKVNLFHSFDRYVILCCSFITVVLHYQTNILSLQYNQPYWKRGQGGKLLPYPLLRGAEGTRSAPLKSINSSIFVSYIKNNMQKLVCHDLTSMKHNSVCFSTVLQYMVVGIMPHGALQRKSAPLRPTSLLASLGITLGSCFVSNAHIIEF